MSKRAFISIPMSPRSVPAAVPARSPALAGLSLRVSPDAWGRSGLGANDGGSGGDVVTSPRNHALILYGRLFAVGTELTSFAPWWPRCRLQPETALQWRAIISQFQ